MQPVYSGNPIDIMNIKLKRFKKYFKGWGSSNFGHARKRRKWLREELGHIEELQENEVLSPELYCKKVEMQVELNSLLLEEEVAWLQKSHDNWLLKDDSNTEYFHRIVDGRRRRNTIVSLSCGDMVIEGNKNMLKHATDFIKNFLVLPVGTCARLMGICGVIERNWVILRTFSYLDPFLIQK
uniref:Uncharacterized protein n=1 Tax=Hordeum vulgare subsp. vulgare TaxID=112509 RepID=A0A8I6Z921_HORVV